MKKLSIALLVIGMISGCSQETSQSNNITDTNQSITAKKILIAYFSFPETDGTDTSSSASRVVVNGEVQGSVQYVASMIQKETNGDLVRIETIQQYPEIHEPLVDQAKEEQNNKSRPELKSQIDNIDSYDTIFLGYPNWWGDMPMPLYTFLTQNDFGSKTIIPFNTHGGSGLSSTLDTIKELQPNATVVSNALTMSRNDVDSYESTVKDWIVSLNIEK